LIVVGAELKDGRQILALLPMNSPGISVDPPTKLVALTGSQTGAVRFDHVELPADAVLAGPEEEVLIGATGASTGGLQTSALAIGLADCAISLMEEQSAKRSELTEPANRLRTEQDGAKEDLLSLAMGGEVCSPGELRGRANSLAIRSSQAALAAVKGAGYVQGHPAGRLCREALFFLVWSCPQPVMAANLCELAGISE
jgi:alkylation response protein AidB-like acyl-CoA dehydrogenase